MCSRTARDVTRLTYDFSTCLLMENDPPAVNSNPLYILKIYDQDSFATVSLMWVVTAFSRVQVFRKRGECCSIYTYFSPTYRNFSYSSSSCTTQKLTDRLPTYLHEA